MVRLKGGRSVLRPPFGAPQIRLGLYHAVTLPGGSSEPVESPNPAVFPAWVRRGISVAMVGGGALMVVAVGPDTVHVDDVDRFALAHGLTALPFLLVGLACTWEVRRVGPPEYARFWRRWYIATFLGVAATAAAIVGGTTHVEAFLALDMALLVTAVPFWIGASIDMARISAGRRSVSVDVIDAAAALVVLCTPGVLLVAEPLAESERLLFAVPFMLSMVMAPGFVYLSTLNLARIPRGERAAHGVGAALAASAGVSLSLQLARVLGGLDLPLRAFIASHVVTMALLGATPVFAHRHVVGSLVRLPAHRQVRQANPMPYVSAVALPLLGVYVFVTHDDRPWGVWFFLGVVMVVVALNAVRYTMMSRETRRLYAGISQMAEERRRLLSRMLRGLEDDRHRTATELHSQAIGSLATLGTLVQMAHVALPSDSATTVKQTITRLQADLGARAEHLRQLMVAIRPAPGAAERTSGGPGAETRAGEAPALADGAGEAPALAGGAGGAGLPATTTAEAPEADDGLAAALLAAAAEQWRDGPTPEVRVMVDPALRLDWTTMTIVYRIAQEALHNVVRHARAATVEVSVTEQEGRIGVEVRDDGVGFDPRRAPPGSGIATMELFTQLGEGELTIRSRPGEGTRVRSLLRGYSGVPDRSGRLRRRAGGDRHLHVVSSPRD
jgi:signal transduction histidine kinase